MAEEWEARARAWLATLPEGATVSMSAVEGWIRSNHDSIPDDLKSMPQSELLQRFSDLQSSLQSPPPPPPPPPAPPQMHERGLRETAHVPSEVKPATQVEFPFRFQRTDRWLPVYTWLESLDTDEVVKSKDISDWLSANPSFFEQLTTKHSRYHLTHYIKKCHTKILKRQGKLKVEPQKSNEATPAKVHNVDTSTAPASEISPYPLVNVPRDSDLYEAKRKEALLKYEILVELEKQLATSVPGHVTARNPKEP